MSRTRRGDADLPPGPARELVALYQSLRGRRPLSIGQIALRSELAPGHVSEVLRGWKAPSPNAAELIARALGADPATMLKARSLAEALSELNRHLRAKGRGGSPGGRLDVPPPPSHFSSRAAEADRIVAAIDASADPHRAVVIQLYGQAGAGKTALACHVAHRIHARYPDGCLFVDVGAMDDTSQVYARLLTRLGVDAGSIPADPAEARALYLSTVRRRSVLVVVDDVASAEQVTALVPASPTCAVIATSRQHLDALDDCCAIHLGALTQAESVALLAAMTQQAGAIPGPDLSRLAAACGGIPGALRMVAAELRKSGQDRADPPAPPPAGPHRGRSGSSTPPTLARSGREAGPRGPITDSSRYEYRLRTTASGGWRVVGIVTGDIRRIRNIDIWVNPENTDMRMARFEEYTISAIVRYEGARRDAAGRVVEDIIAEDLSHRVAGDVPVAAGTAVSTGSGQLAESHNVSAIIHVAAVQGEPGAGYRQVREVGRCVTSALAEVERVADDRRPVSVLFPMLGTGQGGGDVDRTAAVLVGAATDYLTEAAATRVSAVWFLAHTYDELAAFRDVIGGDPRFTAEAT
ncbi:NB-ARC domain-containing protein [Catellatospora sp. KI3]|uniref:NB-ARC domain-containing protein n=1 Tax=Catellatospora sp. KI3 TaxID=3041620 RepID=UPI002482541B|nr:NB-ARC domain-containing protein [Catellatospora sp. KI3]MDI1465404.1 NB-ARC domain-containing protein [Catellatospora sp. KI3]